MRILLVEDDQNIRRALSYTLEAWGHDVTAHDTVASALAALRAIHFDVMVLDINLPDATGWDILREPASNTGPPPLVIVISALPPRTDRVHAFQPFAVLHKPFPIDALHRLVNSAGAHLHGGESEQAAMSGAGMWG